ncbi:Vi polysaccharide biosynthesis UDP-N-acetylglucosamine C-6 dehydrogenase TviB [Cellvibrio japonicus]|uniref:Polysaccharide biosynthesis protein n=1 Tax=Cellvibrio japonicus (strain Ueda107) TaxID=498211 RepID=B3PFB2_CELJU|nr:Vi polysaccharide biosynthesis UDP-N-acetylglucosamine C-6 dehydrogenase TviB [Cellvibrio japonicus]ACE83515.1 polysaccharide biosynthesis protein [Cellvibrio japonicus Ueda107]QEI13659.1 Vi polysaccharide biosynthesis UDP-N-acetylglucosamine C-6 dehydrogenase TviB [Cellvibrio japonicus]QEI17232.1 Vi polysaccharide biosynthesis UDP-N-acetylglucosamine C-6 dehydrogenase TviB [Cellvibrio japonicus]QEI20810.1 Vi polysaccharide biosynthesis UDP-N-acetylglucosamine C-6 dehydrogenase TviB [Cellvib
MFASNPRLCIIGLGYVGLPLAVEFGKKIDTIGFDINPARIDALRQGEDHTLELNREELTQATRLSYTTRENDITGCDVYIVTVPTPINDSKQPDLTPLEKASALLGRVIDKNAIVVFESTVYPGCTEEVCVPIIEQGSGLVFNRDFFAGYSPERINPGDKQHRVHNITKITSGSTPEVAEYIDQLYRQIVVVGTHKASSIKVAEAAKVIENTQRDINIALVNELALIFKRLDIDTLEVLEAAGTKWNFLPFRPGLVGGHCISVDPYYLTHKAQQVGYNPEVILAGRRINDGMGTFVAESVVKMMTQRKCHVVDSNILIMGLTFKENCPDLRNTRVIDIIHELKNYNANVHVYDPWADPVEAQHEYGLALINQPQANTYDAIILCVGHEQFRALGADAIRTLGKTNHVLFDVKHVLPKAAVDARL